jgi:hypothetical protein
MYISILRSFAFGLDFEREQDRFNHAREKATRRQKKTVIKQERPAKEYRKAVLTS